MSETNALDEILLIFELLVRADPCIGDLDATLDRLALARKELAVLRAPPALPRLRLES